MITTNFHFPADGIIGTDFLHKHRAHISFNSKSIQITFQNKSPQKKVTIAEQHNIEYPPTDTAISPLPAITKIELSSDIQSMLKGKVTFKILKGGCTVTLEDHSSMKQFLAQQHLPFYTYTRVDKNH